MPSVPSAVYFHSPRQQTCGSAPAFRPPKCTLSLRASATARCPHRKAQGNAYVRVRCVVFSCFSKKAGPACIHPCSIEGSHVVPDPPRFRLPGPTCPGSASPQVPGRGRLHKESFSDEGVNLRTIGNKWYRLPLPPRMSSASLPRNQQGKETQLHFHPEVGSWRGD